MDAHQFILRLPESVARALRAAAAAQARKDAAGTSSAASTTMVRGAGARSSLPSVPGSAGPVFRYMKVKPSGRKPTRISKRGKGKSRETDSEEPGTGRYVFFVGEQQFNATMLRLPCSVETPKTVDGTTFYKSGNIAQILVVHPNDVRDTQTASRRGKPVEQCAFGVDQVPAGLKLSSGMTPPTAHIVQRRFEKTRKPKFDKAEVKVVEDQLLSLQGSGSAAGGARKPKLRTSREELVRWQPYMEDWPDQLVVYRTNGRITRTAMPDGFVPPSQRGQSGAGSRLGAGSGAAAGAGAGSGEGVRGGARAGAGSGVGARYDPDFGVGAGASSGAGLPGAGLPSPDTYNATPDDNGSDPFDSFHDDALDSPYSSPYFFGTDSTVGDAGAPAGQRDPAGDGNGDGDGDGDGAGAPDTADGGHLFDEFGDDFLFSGLDSVDSPMQSPASYGTEASTEQLDDVDMDIFGTVNE